MYTLLNITAIKATYLLKIKTQTKAIYTVLTNCVTSAESKYYYPIIFYKSFGCVQHISFVLYRCKIHLKLINSWCFYTLLTFWITPLPRLLAF